MNKTEKIHMVMTLTNCTEDQARDHLDAEAWIVTEAVFDILAERRIGLLA
jgi:hypothetical protein